MGLIFLVLSACKKKETEKEYLGSGHPAWWPIMYQSNDLIVGAAPEIFTKIFSKLGLKVSFKYVGSWDVVQEKMKSGEVVLLAGAYQNDARKEFMAFSDPYTIDPVSIFVKKGKTFPFANWNELINKKGVVTVGDSYGQKFDQYIKDSLNVVAVATPDEAFELLSNGQADYFVYALYSGRKAIASKNLQEQIDILPNYVSSEKFYLAISKKSELVDYLPQVNQLIKQYIADGTIDLIIAKHNVY